MSSSAYLVVVAVGAGTIGLWIVARFGRLTPKSALGAASCFALAWAAPGLMPTLLAPAMGRFAAGFAILTVVFPVLVATFALVGLGLRYVVDAAGHAIR
jgi:hypothetical protein